ncbi:MAG: EpsG family protein [Chitinivibrionia bacterium]|nr:EpsG family protein [Chitinivibrionia bacterium]
MVTFLLFVIPSSFRAEGLGTDYLPYKKQFYEVVNDMDISNQHWEAGFYYLCVFIDKIGLDYHWLFAIMSFFTILFLFLSVSKRTFAIIVPVYAFINYLTTYNAVRQGLTFTMGYYAYTLYQKKKYVPAFIIIGIGCLFHKSILFLVPILLIMNFFKIDRKWSFVCFFAILVVLKLFAMDMVEFGLSTVVTIFGYGDRITVENMLYLMANESTSGGMIVFRIGILFAILFLINDVKNRNGLSENFLYKVRFLLLLYFFMEIFHAWTFQEFVRIRIVYDFALFIPLAVIYNYSKYRKLFFTGYFLWLVRNLYVASTLNINEVFPYKSLLF